MLGLDSSLKCAVSGLVWLVIASASVTSQKPVAQKPVSQKPVANQDKLEQVRAAAEKWLVTDHTSKELMADTVVAVLKTPRVGLAWLGEQLPAASNAPNETRSKGLRSLCTQVTLEFLRRTHGSGMTFVGQYNPLKGLQPFAGNFVFQLLLETPEWYPLTFRVRLVPALRDIQLRSPSVARLDGILEIVNDERETTGLRNALAAALWQWGKPEHARKVLKQLMAETAEGDGEDRVDATLFLADYYNVLRDYKSSARAHRTAQALAKASKVQLPPIAFYAAACVQALQGDVDAGIKSLETCARMHASPDLDRSLRLERSLFEKDPEITVLRKDKRFAELLKLAFGEAKKADKTDGAGKADKDDVANQAGKDGR